MGDIFFGKYIVNEVVVWFYGTAALHKPYQDFKSVCNILPLFDEKSFKKQQHIVLNSVLKQFTSMIRVKLHLLFHIYKFIFSPNSEGEYL